jgi:ABC-type amino acid transport substrate-binding protein
MSLTLKPGILSVASAYPDPPFKLADGSENGFDIDLMRAICAHLGLQLQPRRSPLLVRPLRNSRSPYLEFNQGVAVNRERTPNIWGESDLHGLTAGIQVGNTSNFGPAAG